MKIVLDEMFTMSNMVVRLLQNFLKQFAKEGITKVPYEEVRLYAKQITAVCARLAEVDALPQEVPGYILEGFTRCLVVEFRDIHRLLNTADIVCQMQAVTGKWNSKEIVASMSNFAVRQTMCSIP